jgi:hypothetical protein
MPKKIIIVPLQFQNINLRWIFHFQFSLLGSLKANQGKFYYVICGKVLSSGIYGIVSYKDLAFSDNLTVKIDEFVVFISIKRQMAVVQSLRWMACEMPLQPFGSLPYNFGINCWCRCGWRLCLPAVAFCALLILRGNVRQRQLSEPFLPPQVWSAEHTSRILTDEWDDIEPVQAWYSIKPFPNEKFNAIFGNIWWQSVG